MPMPILMTKLYIPPARSGLVSRPHLFARLDQALQLRKRLTLVAAKAGSGKTTLISTWAHQQEQPVAWLSLDTNDNDPRRFFGYLVAALRQLDIKLDPSILSQLETPQLPPEG